jgi:hypothetical protein
MSDELTFWQQVSQIKAVLTVVISAALGAMVLGGFIMEWRIDVNVQEQLSKQDIGTDAKIVAMDHSIAMNERTGQENAEDIDQNRERVIAAFDALTGGRSAE